MYEAQKRYMQKVRKEGKLKTFSLSFTQKDMRLLEHVKAQGNATKYIKRLIERDIDNA